MEGDVCHTTALSVVTDFSMQKALSGLSLSIVSLVLLWLEAKTTGH